VEGGGKKEWWGLPRNIEGHFHSMERGEGRKETEEWEGKSMQWERSKKQTQGGRRLCCIRGQGKINDLKNLTQGTRIRVELT